MRLTAGTAAYATRNGGLFVRDLVGGQAIEIWRGELVVEFQWTREGSDILLSGIQDDRLGLWLVPRLGGPGRRLNARGAHIALSPDGRLFARAMQNSQGFTVSPIDGNGDTRIQMTGFQWLLGLDWGLTSKRLAVLTQDEDGSRSVWTIAPDGADRRLLYTAKNLASLRWSPLTNELYVIRGRNELADVVRLKDEARSSDEQVVVSGLPWDDSDPYQQSVSLSTDGRKFLVIRSFTYANLWRISGKNGSPSPITTGTSRYNRPRVSPDGQWIAATLGVGAKSMVVKIATTGGPAIPVTPPNRRATSPAWSPDGSRIAFAAQRDGVPRIWIAQADGTEAFEVANSVTDTDDGDISWFSGDRIIWQLPGSENYTVRDLRSNEQEMLLENSAAPNGWLTNLRVSPTGGDIVFLA